MRESLIVINKIKTQPIFVIEDPNFLGLPTSEGGMRAEKYKGSRSTEVEFISLYIHGALERHCGYDVARFTQGTVKDKDIQHVVVVDAKDNKHDSILVSVQYEGKRYGLIVYKTEARKTYDYLKRVRNEARVSGLTRIFL